MPVSDNLISQRYSTLHVHARDIRRYDAVGMFAQQVAKLAANAGWRTRLWAENFDRMAGEEIEPRDQFWQAVHKNDVIFFNFSIFDPAIERLLQVGVKKIMYYHNITPPALLDDEADVENARLGRSQIPLACGFDVVIANSLVSKRALIADLPGPQRSVFENTVITCPPVIGVDRWRDIAAEPRLLYARVFC